VNSRFLSVIARPCIGKEAGKMTKSKPATITLSLSLLGAGLCASLTAFLAANPAAASELLTGHYYVVPATNGPAPLFFTVEASNGIQTWTKTVGCVLPNAAESLNAYCPEYDVELPVAAVESNNNGTLIEVDFLPVAIWAENHDLDIVAIDPDEPLVSAAEAYWTGFIDRWVCFVEEADLTKCTGHCGLAGIESLTAAPYPTNPLWGIPAAEPQCEVTCNCKGDRETDTWIDLPQIVPAF
jgi:hypothetical protein